MAIVVYPRHYRDLKPNTYAEPQFGHPMFPNVLCIPCNESVGEFCLTYPTFIKGITVGGFFNGLFGGTHPVWDSSNPGSRFPVSMIRHNDPNNIMLQFQNSENFLPTTACTVLIHYRKNDTTNRASVVFGPDDAGVAARLSTHLPYSDGNIYWDFGGATEGVTRLKITGHTFDTQDHIWVFTSGPSGMEVWLDGILLGSNGASPTRSGTGNWYVGFGLGGTTGDEASFGFIYMWDYQLSHAAIQSLSIDPFQFWHEGVPNKAFPFIAAFPATGDFFSAQDGQ